MKNSRLALVLWLMAALTAPAMASPELCETAALSAGAEHGVPAEVMLALALTETGRLHGGRLRPWPWAANLEGQGHWFDSAEAVLQFARARLAEGRTSLDLGCFQVNWRWHGAAFPGPEALLDPLENARYAARFLAALRTEFGSWEAAAGAYHSRSPALAARYRARFAERLAGLVAREPNETRSATNDAAAAPLAGALPGGDAHRARRMSAPPVPQLAAAPLADPVTALASLVALPARQGSHFVPGLRP